MPRVSVTKNDLEALKAAFAGFKTSAAKLLQMEAAVAAVEGAVDAAGHSTENAEPPAELIRAATAHAIAAAAFSGLLHRLFAPAREAASAAELTDSAGENA